MFRVMEWGQQAKGPQMTDDQLYGFLEFVPGGSNRSTVTESACSTQGGSSSTTSVPEPPLQTHGAHSTDEAKSNVAEPSQEGDADGSQLLSVDTMVAQNNHSAGSFNECGICGPAKAIWVPEKNFRKSETGEPLVEQISEHGQNIKIDPLDTFWIQCDCCEKWFHGSCVGVEEYEDVLIDKFHCAPCAQTSGPTKSEPSVLFLFSYAFLGFYFLFRLFYLFFIM
ncbi:hypothetical protein COOONC_24872 [Cooperia oncophora]